MPIRDRFKENILKLYRDKGYFWLSYFPRGAPLGGELPSPTFLRKQKKSVVN